MGFRPIQTVKNHVEKAKETVSAVSDPNIKKSIADMSEIAEVFKYALINKTSEISKLSNEKKRAIKEVREGSLGKSLFTDELHTGLIDLIKDGKKIVSESQNFLDDGRKLLKEIRDERDNKGSN